MAITVKSIIGILFVLSIAGAKPTVYNDPETNINLDNDLLTAIETNPKLYLIIAEAVDTDNDGNNENASDTDFIAIDSASESKIEKRSVEDEDKDKDDLETAAGTNVLRPLFVYRQQLAYREQRVKGAVRRSAGIRPRF